MSSTWIGVFLPFLILLWLWYRRKKNKKKVYISRKVINNRIMKKKMRKGHNIMQELAKRFIGKDCYINLLDGTVDGVISEVTEGGIVLDKGEKQEVVNLDYVVRIREYPYKNGKRASFIGD